MGILIGELNFHHNKHYPIAIKTYLTENDKRKYIVKTNNRYVVMNLKDNDEDDIFEFNADDTNIDIKDVDKLILVVSKLVEGENVNFTESDINREFCLRRREIELALQQIRRLE